MTKKEAIAFAISTGNPIAHKFFTAGEYVRYRGEDLMDEDGVILPNDEFWLIRSGGDWEDGWEEYKG